MLRLDCLQYAHTTLYAHLLCEPPCTFINLWILTFVAYAHMDSLLYAAFPFMHTFYPADFVRTFFVRYGVINSDQTVLNVGVSFCADFCTDK